MANFRGGEGGGGGPIIDFLRVRGKLSAASREQFLAHVRRVAQPGGSTSGAVAQATGLALLHLQDVFTADERPTLVADVARMAAVGGDRYLRGFCLQFLRASKLPAASEALLRIWMAERWCPLTASISPY